METTIEVAYPVFIVTQGGESGLSAVRNHLGEDRRDGLAVFTSAEGALAWAKARPYYREFVLTVLPTRRAFYETLRGLGAEVELVCFDPPGDQHVEVDDLLAQVLDDGRHRRAMA